jgi:hypothetical protein
LNKEDRKRREETSRNGEKKSIILTPPEYLSRPSGRTYL